MNKLTFFAVGAIGLAAASGCFTGPELDQPNRAVPVQTTNAAEPAPSALDVPCDVARVLATSCLGCHGAAPSGGAPNALVTRADLVAPSASDPAISAVELSIARMRSAKQPMPPSGLVDAENADILEAWVAAGSPAGACTEELGAPPKTSEPVPTVCTSETEWTRGNRGDPRMHPGGTCISCHAKEDDAPTYTVAGTVYPTVHEPDDCYGQSGATVIIKGADGKSVTLKSNESGNFFSMNAIKLPYTAKIVVNGKERAMKTPQKDGDCNGCHTERGNNAPGRITGP